MPIKVGVPESWQLITPTAEWQTMKTPLKKDKFQVATDLYYIALNPPPQAAVKANINFDGTWDGKYQSNDGQTGEGKYEFHQEKDGRWDVTVSWDKGTKMMQLKGERLGPDSLRLEGKFGDTTYWYMGRLESNDLVLRYLSVEQKTGTSGTGVSKLTRPK
jgi:hypothetical protein